MPITAAAIPRSASCAQIVHGRDATRRDDGVHRERRRHPPSEDRSVPRSCPSRCTAVTSTPPSGSSLSCSTTSSMSYAAACAPIRASRRAARARRRDDDLPGNARRRAREPLGLLDRARADDRRTPRLRRASPRSRSPLRTPPPTCTATRTSARISRTIAELSPRPVAASRSTTCSR